jgi:hypothetical protein
MNAASLSGLLSGLAFSSLSMALFVHILNPTARGENEVWPRTATQCDAKRHDSKECPPTIQGAAGGVSIINKWRIQFQK